MIYESVHKLSKSDVCGISLKNLPLPTAGNQLGLFIATVDPNGALASSRLRPGMRIIFIAINGLSYNTIGWTSAFASCVIQDSVGSIMIAALDNDQHGTTVVATAATTSYATLAAPLPNTRTAVEAQSSASSKPQQSTDKKAAVSNLNRKDKIGDSLMDTETGKDEDLSVRISKYLSPEYQGEKKAEITDKKAALQAVMQSAVSNSNGKVDPKLFNAALSAGYSKFFILGQVEDTLKRKPSPPKPLPSTKTKRCTNTRASAAAISSQQTEAIPRVRTRSSTSTTSTVASASPRLLAQQASEESESSTMDQS